MLRSLSLVAAFGVLAIFANSAGADAHHDGTKGKVTTKGHHAHPVIAGGKVTGVAAHHRTTGKRDNTVATKKFKTANKKHLNDGIVMGDADDAGVQGGFAWVGWAFFCPFDNHWVIFWFPAAQVQGGDNGAEEI